MRRIALLTLALLACRPTAQAATLVRDFYLPMPEAQVRQTFTSLEKNISTILNSVFPVVFPAPAPFTVVLNRGKSCLVNEGIRVTL